jgi:hypothetical protein
VTSIDYSAAVGAFTTETAARLRALALRGRFEAHLTVDTDDGAAFDDACRALGVDCVLIALPAGAHRAQPMTASHHEGDLAQVLDEIDALHAALEARGLRIVRAKLEAHVENPGIPPSEAEAALLGGYFEYHLKVRTDVVIVSRREARGDMRVAGEPRDDVRVAIRGSREPQNDERLVVAVPREPHRDVVAEPREPGVVAEPREPRGDEPGVVAEPREPREPRGDVAIEAKIRALGVEVGNHMSSLDADDVALIRKWLESEAQARNPTSQLGEPGAAARGTVLRVRRLEPRVAAERLRAAAAPHGAHVSANDRKPGQRFVTLRVYRSTLTEAEARLAALERAIADAGFAIAGTIREYTLADTRIELDAGWLEPPTS